MKLRDLLSSARRSARWKALKHPVLVGGTIYRPSVRIEQARFWASGYKELIKALLERKAMRGRL